MASACPGGLWFARGLQWAFLTHSDPTVPRVGRCVTSVPVCNFSEVPFVHLENESDDKPAGPPHRNVTVVCDIQIE